jgi:hypothetical protein
MRFTSIFHFGRLLFHLGEKNLLLEQKNFVLYLGGNKIYQKDGFW